MWKSKFVATAAAFAALVVGLFITCPAIAQPAEARIDAALQNITNLVRKDQVGYATIFDGNKFVQCRRLEDRTLRCEAAGTVMQSSLKNILTNDRLSTLSKMGWALDPSFGNYVRVFPSGTPTNTAAENLLSVLKDGYAANPADIEVATSWVADVPCPPRAGPSQNLAGSVNDAPSMQGFIIKACFFLPDPAPAQTAASVDELFAIYGTTVAAELQRLRINAISRVFAIFQAGIGYVQCQPYLQSKVMYCEAQSAESWPALAAVLTPERISWLHDKGYADPGRAPNYSKSYPFSKYDDAAIAREILSVLYTAYGYRGAEKLKIETER